MTRTDTIFYRSRVDCIQIETYSNNCEDKLRLNVNDFSVLFSAFEIINTILINTIYNCYYAPTRKYDRRSRWTVHARINWSTWNINRLITCPDNHRKCLRWIIVGVYILRLYSWWFFFFFVSHQCDFKRVKISIGTRKFIDFADRVQRCCMPG